MAKGAKVQGDKEGQRFSKALKWSFSAVTWRSRCDGWGMCLLQSRDLGVAWLKDQCSRAFAGATLAFLLSVC